VPTASAPIEKNIPPTARQGEIAETLDIDLKFEDEQVKEGIAAATA
jgi:hypothetical protein